MKKKVETFGQWSDWEMIHRGVEPWYIRSREGFVNGKYEFMSFEETNFLEGDRLNEYEEQQKKKTEKLGGRIVKLKWLSDKKPKAKRS